MPEHHDIARAVFDEIRESFPHLAMRESRSDNVDLQVDIPVQDELTFEVSLYLADDILNICVGEFWGEWFPCTDSEVVSGYTEAVKGLLSGRFRIVEHSRNGRFIKAVLQRPTGTGWSNISRHYHGLSLPWLSTDQRILQNGAV